MFAIVDVETTGGHPSGHGMTEIAIVLHDGIRVKREYCTLLNPRQPIPLNIQTLTGITPDMVQEAPTFAEKAVEIREVLQDHVFVAHNVNFDYSFVKAAFESCGISYNPKRLCSVRYARKVEAGLRSYSLKNLCRHFGIQNEAAHRAWGDARATAVLMERLFEKDTRGQWQYLIKKNSGEFNLPAHLPSEEYHTLPEAPGVYYFLDETHKPIYIGKAGNLKKRVSTHFTSDKETKKSQGFKREIYHIDFEQTGSRFLAGLLEDHEIRHHWPKYNLAQKRPKKKFGLFAYQAVSGNWHLAINRVTKQQGFLAEFYSRQEASSKVLQWINEFKLDPAFCGIPALPFSTEQAPGQEPEHNEGFKKLLHHLGQQRTSFLIRTNGRTSDEAGFAYVNGEGQLEGIGYVPKEMEVKEAEELFPYLRKIRSSVTIRGMIDKVLHTHEYQVISLKA